MSSRSDHRRSSEPSTPGHDPSGEDRLPSGGGEDAHARFPSLQTGRYGRYVAVVGLILVIGLTASTLLRKPGGLAGLTRGERAPPFAVPAAAGSIEGAADVALHPNEGARGLVPACRERGRGILNICELWERGPVVLALFVNEGSCTDVLGEMQALARRFPAVSFAAVAIRSERPALLALVRRRHLSMPVGYDLYGTLTPLYKDVSCPQVNFIYPGGRIEHAALLRSPSQSVLATRVRALIDASRAKGWSGRMPTGSGG